MGIDNKLIDYAWEGNTLGVMLMLDMGADVHSYNDEALRLASYKNHTEVVKILKEYKNKGEKRV